MYPKIKNAMVYFDSFYLAVSPNKVMTPALYLRRNIIIINNIIILIVIICVIERQALYPDQRWM